MADPRYKWNANAGRYVAPSGRFVSQKQVLDALDAALDASSAAMHNASLALRNGQMSLRNWQLLMRREIKNVHLYTGASAKGGWAQLAPSDFGRIGQRIKEQYRYLDKFAADIAAGRAPLDGRLVQRSRLYGQAGRQTNHLMGRAESLRRGLSKERSILSGNEHCSECKAEASRSWVNIGTLVPIGSRICNMNCRCRTEYK